MELDQAIFGRRSIRKYKDRDIPPEDLEQLLDLARQAPSSMNGQPWYFIIIKDYQTKMALAHLKNKYCPREKQTYQADFLLQAPVIIVVCVDKQRSFEREVENAVLATAYLLLAAHSRGLGAVYMSAYRGGDPRLTDDIRLLLAIPPEVEPITLIPLGYPDENPETKLVRPLREMVLYETFGKH